MRLQYVLLWLVSGVVAQTAPAIPEAPAPTKPAVVFDRDAFTFTRYALNITLNLPRHGFAVRGSVTLRNDSQQPQSAAALQISSTLKWAAIRSGEASLAVTSSRISHDIDHTGSVNEAVVEFSKPVPPGESINLEIGYQGSIDQDATRLQRLGMPGTVASRSDWDVVSGPFTAVRGVGHVVWYPVAMAPVTLDDGNKVFQELGVWSARHAASRFRMTFGEGTEKGLFTNGMKKSDVENVYELERMGLGGPFFMVADRPALQTANGRVLYQADSEDAARKVGSSLAQIEPVVTNGKPAQVVIVQLPAGWAAYENDTVLLTPFAWNSSKEMEQQLVHTITHANLFSARSWIYEGLAHMAQVDLKEKQEGRAAALEFLEQRRAPLTLISPTESGPNDARNSLINATDEIYYRSKAMWVWWMLRDMLGPATLKKAMTNYQAEADKEPAYVQRLLEAASGKDLEWFFDDWVYRDRGLPDLRIVSVYPRQNLKGSYLVTVTVENLGTAGAEVPVRVRMKEGEAVARLIVKGKSQATVRVETPRLPEQVIVNDGSILESDNTNNLFTVTPEKQ